MIWNTNIRISFPSFEPNLQRASKDTYLIHRRHNSFSVDLTAHLHTLNSLFLGSRKERLNHRHFVFMLYLIIYIYWIHFLVVYIVVIITTCLRSVRFQMGHLLEVCGRFKQAKATYEQILEASKSESASHVQHLCLRQLGLSNSLYLNLYI